MAESARIMESVKKETASDDKDLSPDGLAYNVSSFELEVERCVAFAICDLDGLGATEERGGPRVRAVLRACKLHRWEPLGKCWPAPMRIGGAAQARQLRSVASGRAASSGVTRGGWQGSSPVFWACWVPHRFMTVLGACAAGSSRSTAGMQRTEYTSRMRSRRSLSRR